MKKYFKSRTEANCAKKARDPKGFYGLHVWKMQKGTRHHGEYAVCTEIEYLNTY